MATFKIKMESSPERCEICHKTDLFNPQTGYCSRCAVLIINKKAETITPVIDSDRAITPMRSQQVSRQERRIKKVGPVEITVKLNDESMEIIRSRIHDLNIIPFVIILCIIIGFFFPIPILLLIILGTLLIPILSSSRDIKITSNAILIYRHFLPLPARRIYHEDFDQIYIKRRQTGMYKMYAAKKDGKEEFLLSSDRLEVAKYIEEQIENYLSIKNRPYPGEE